MKQRITARCMVRARHGASRYPYAACALVGVPTGETLGLQRTPLRIPRGEIEGKTVEDRLAWARDWLRHRGVELRPDRYAEPVNACPVPNGTTPVFDPEGHPIMGPRLGILRAAWRIAWRGKPPSSDRQVAAECCFPVSLVAEHRPALQGMGYWPLDARQELLADAARRKSTAPAEP